LNFLLPLQNILLFKTSCFMK